MWKSSSIDPCILNFSTRQRWVVSLTPQPPTHIIPWRKNPSTHPTGGWVNTRNGMDIWVGEDRDFFGHPAGTIVTTQNCLVKASFKYISKQILTACTSLLIVQHKKFWTHIPNTFIISYHRKFHEFLYSGSQLTVTDLEHAAYRHIVSTFVLEQTVQNMHIFFRFSNTSMLVAIQCRWLIYSSLACA
jgi:hypothetical protein